MYFDYQAVSLPTTAQVLIHSIIKTYLAPAQNLLVMHTSNLSIVVKMTVFTMTLE